MAIVVVTICETAWSESDNWTTTCGKNEDEKESFQSGGLTRKPSQKDHPGHNFVRTTTKEET